MKEDRRLEWELLFSKLEIDQKAGADAEKYSTQKKVIPIQDLPLIRLNARRRVMPGVEIGIDFWCD